MYLDSTTHVSAKDFLEEKGYLIIKDLIGPDLRERLLHQLKSNIISAAKDIGYEYDEYLSVVSRWVNPSLICDRITESLRHHVSVLLSNLTNGGNIVKENIISKTCYSPNPIPVHQDISYQAIPYQYSAWVGLTDAPIESGCLEVLPGSHKDPIEPAVDFWVPTYKDCVRDSLRWKSSAISLPVEAGDVIIFDSRLWHGSGYNSVKLERFAAVFRWTGSSYKFPIIPPHPTNDFGMWTCQAKTEEILRRAAPHFFAEEAKDFIQLLDNWIGYLEDPTLPFNCDIKKSQAVLKKLRILHMAYEHHNGGEAQGSIYPSLWETFLKPLSSH